ncbi:MAG TPA: CpsD/CapB family tyrosine-protein kinase [Bacillota bacterium]|nr:CpsD/CapB family tyrosine-protein kinase [Bacillota bacterium]HPF42281.1 CpsD/CapB family tyrosine-protein kinase [Bacillota bacterium]HPJ86115.1 CpsD/CapB family tyrosine-protein kinase [Bacillota bacterium]HPQ61952.1 CpsD/CapB family tyrosine-protein kinase [Bacillota bacterium]
MEYFEYHNVVIESPNSREAEAYRKLELNIAMMSLDEKIQVIQSTSAIPEDGKTTTAINLAAVYAEKGEKVIIVDFDLRRPKIHRAFKKPNEKGFYDYVNGDIDFHDIIVHDESGIDLILTGKHLSFPHIVLESHKASDLIAKLRKEYDYIIVDTPPVLSVTDSLIVSKYADGVLYVVAYNKTKKDDAKAGLLQLQKNHARVLGSVFANIDIKKFKGYHGYDYYSHQDKTS